jgi:hypothetical protein
MWAVLGAHDLLAIGWTISDDATLQHPVYRPRRTHPPRARVNKDKRAVGLPTSPPHAGWMSLRPIELFRQGYAQDSSGIHRQVLPCFEPVWRRGDPSSRISLVPDYSRGHEENVVEERGTEKHDPRRTYGHRVRTIICTQNDTTLGGYSLCRARCTEEWRLLRVR